MHLKKLEALESRIETAGDTNKLVWYNVLPNKTCIIHVHSTYSVIMISEYISLFNEVSLLTPQDSVCSYIYSMVTPEMLLILKGFPPLPNQSALSQVIMLLTHMGLFGVKENEVFGGNWKPSPKQGKSYKSLLLLKKMERSVNWKICE